MDQLVQSDLPVFNWGDFTDFHQSPPLLPESGTSEVTSVLSARSYLLPESHNPQNAQSSTPSPGRSDLALELASSFNRTDTNQTPLSKPMKPRPQKRQRGGSKKAAPAKDRGAPRGAGESKENPEERRRLQARMAQRAYRSRQQAIVDGLNNRISLLETSMEKMSSAMLSFSEHLVQSGLLGSQPALTANLRDTMKVFYTMAAGVSHDDEDDGIMDSNKTIESPPALQQPTIERPPPLGGTGSYPNNAVLPDADNTPGISIMEVSAFIQKLLLVALYQGYLALRDPSIGMDRLQRPFGLIFGIMDRERLTSHFKAEFYSLLNQRPLDGWDEVPFFRLGGAGTHYLHARSTGAFASYYQSGPTVEDPLSLATADLRAQLEGDWFDLQDLEGYIRDKNVLLVASAGEPTTSSKVPTSINVSRFISSKSAYGL
ncbi:bZIP transcription factor [Aspergillus puulaauensis]|uniref:BZIP transcription factor n=1 Tax=Aspergillus puulaauensis TaxID=1220207 RepID=A0A7R7XV14_9EURO|nr:uncharacterized protein APUU_60980A [Aspergillus puulaauensis]BCS27932.1 hypothetical protein APUU_60980A [Aspergillus puulaauensis]